MWKRKVSVKEQYGSLRHLLKGDEDCHYIGQRYIEGTNIFARREWRGVKDTSYAFYRWLVTWVKMGASSCWAGAASLCLVFARIPSFHSSSSSSCI